MKATALARAAINFGRRAFVIFVTLLLLVSNVRLIAPTTVPAGHSDVDDHLRFVRGRIDDNLASDMQAYFPEGYFFTYVLYGLSWVNIGLTEDNDSSIKAEALTEARFALSQLDSPQGRAPFSPNLNPSYGVFYVGWSNYLRSGIISLQDDADQAELDALATDCNAVIDALDASASPFLTSYPGQAWPVDMYPAMVAMHGCEQFLDDGYRDRTYEQIVLAWLDAVDAETDPEFGLVGHRSEPVVEHPRATSQTLILRFLAELDPERAQADYLKFRKQFQSSLLGLPVVREHPFGIDRPGDVDSGPLISGATASGTVVAMATAQANGDHHLAKALHQQAASGGFPIKGPGGTRYALGAMPIGDLFVIWARTSHVWFQPDAPSDTTTPQVERSVSRWWRVPIMAISLITIGLLWFLLWPGLRIRMSRLGSRMSRLRGRDSRPIRPLADSGSPN